MNFRSITLFVGIALLTACGSEPESAQEPLGMANSAIKKQEMVIVYYDDEEHRHIVGQVIFFCDGTRFRRGALTLYSEEIDYGCD